MKRPKHWGRPALLALIAVLCCGGAFAGLALSDQSRAPTASAQRRPATSPRRPRLHVDTVVTISRTAVGRPIPSGFVGLSFEYPVLTVYAGSDPHAVNPVLEQLIRNLAPGQRPVLRIGGDSTDTTWWPERGLHRPGGVSFSLSGRWMAVARALADGVGARLIVGLDLEAGVPALATAEGRAFLRYVGRPALRAFEIGNEAPRYGLFPWYHTGPGHPVLARPPSYDFQAFNREFAAVARLLPPRSPPLAGPTLGGPDWMPNLPEFIASEPRLGLVTYHSYPYNRCFVSPGSTAYPTVPRLLSRFASRGDVLALNGYASIANGRGLPFRVDEINSVACGGKAGVSDRFASALWALDSLFELARIGVSGVNFHMFPDAAYRLFSFQRVNGRWFAHVRPEYYGLMMFAQAAQPGSRLLSTSTRGGPSMRGWSTISSDGSLHVVLINDDLHRRHVVLVQPPAAGGTADVERLSAPSAYASGRVTLGGQSFGRTGTGRLEGAAPAETLTPSRGHYVLALAPASAVMLTIPRS